MPEQWKTDGLILTHLVGSPDGRHWAAVAETSDGESTVVVDGVRGEPYEIISNPLFLASGRVVYEAEASDQAFVVVDGHAEATYMRVSELVVRGDAYAYLGVAKPDKMAVVCNGKTIDAFAEAGDLALGDTGELAFWASMKGKRGVDAKLKGKSVILHNDVVVVGSGSSVSSPKLGHGGEIAYLESNGKTWTVHRGTEVVGTHEWVASPAFSADGSTLIWAARDAKGRWSVVVDGRPTGDHDDVGALALCADGSAYAYAAMDGDSWSVVSVNATSKGFESVSTVEITPDGRPVFVAHRDGALVVGIGTEVFGPFECVGEVRPQLDGHVRFVAGQADALRLHLDGKPAGAVFEVLSDPVFVDGKTHLFGCASGVVHRVVS